MSKLKVKICGNGSSWAEIEAEKPDYLGFIFYQRSPRYFPHFVSKPLPANKESACKRIGVFVDSSAGDIVRHVHDWNLDGVQLHGSETAAQVLTIKQSLPEAIIIKAIQVGGEFDFDIVKPFYSIVDFILFDTQTSAYGGSGKRFNWEVLKGQHFQTPFFLAGGIGIEQLDKAISFFGDNPAFHGVDLNSRIETSPGVKDIQLVREAISRIRR